MLDVDILIVGAGPAGCSAAIHLEGSGKRVVLLDRHDFPRDKICGDALSGNATYELSKLPGGRLADFAGFSSKESTGGIRFVSPGGYVLDLDLLGSRPGLDSPGYVCSRYAFDHFLYQEAEQTGATCIRDRIRRVERIALENGKPGFELGGDSGTYRAPLLLVADGVNGSISKSLTGAKLLRRHHSAGLRCYMKNVTGFSEKRLIELHFIPELLPGYFWLFPMREGIANIGLGVRADVVQKKRIDLKARFTEIIQQHPVLAPRFAEATAMETIQGAGLPLGSTWRTITGDGFMLLGDAAGLVDPFSGEGIGNAMASGRLAAEQALRSFRLNDFSGRELHTYTRNLKRVIGGELKVSSALQSMLRFPSLFDRLTKRAEADEELRRQINAMLHQPSARRALLWPGFWWKVLR